MGGSVVRDDRARSEASRKWRVYVFMVRVAAFCMILYGVLEKTGGDDAPHLSPPRHDSASRRVKCGQFHGRSREPAILEITRVVAEIDT